MRILLRGNTRQRTVSRPKNNYQKTPEIEAPVIETAEESHPFVAIRTENKIEVKKDVKSRTTEHLVELDELTAVTQSLMELCNEVLGDK